MHASNWTAITAMTCRLDGRVSVATTSISITCFKLSISSFTFSNGQQRWDYDLSRESMVVSLVQP